MDFVITLLRLMALYAIPTIIVFVLLYFTVRAAVLSALRRHHADTRFAQANTPRSHLDQDGI